MNYLLQNPKLFLLRNVALLISKSYHGTDKVHVKAMYKYKAITFTKNLVQTSPVDR